MKIKKRAVLIIVIIAIIIHLIVLLTLDDKSIEFAPKNENGGTELSKYKE